MGCKGCKKNSLNRENEEQPVPRTQKFVFLLLIVYTVLAVYGLIRLIFDIKNLF